MRRSRIVVSLLAVIVALVLQTTVFSAGRIQPLGVSPSLVVLVLVGIAPFIEAEYHILLGFTSGILVDLIGSGTLGLWAMALTAVAFIANRLGTRYADSILMSIVVAFGLTVFSQVLYVLLGTLFGQETISEPSLLKKILLPAVWNVILAYPTFWLLRFAFQPRDRKWAP